MASVTTVPFSRWAVTAIVAGIAGAVVFELYLWLTVLLPTHETLTAHWQWIASTVFGKGALSDPRFAPAGALIHLLVSIGWAGGYVYVIRANPAIGRRWAVSGIVYGLVVYTIMQTILLADNSFIYPPNPNAFVNALIAHGAFFGLPLAFVAARLQPAP